jgi:hypothetical protein
MGDQEAMDLVRGYVRGGGSGGGGDNGDFGKEEEPDVASRMEGVSSFLVNEALQRGSADNITIILYWLQIYWFSIRIHSSFFCIPQYMIHIHCGMEEQFRAVSSSGQINI